MPVKATAAGIVLVEKSESEKVHRLKTTYTEKIVPLLMEEFSYTNKHQVTKLLYFSILQCENLAELLEFGVSRVFHSEN